jgi:hypothetical protein
MFEKIFLNIYKNVSEKLILIVNLQQSKFKI